MTLDETPLWFHAADNGQRMIVLNSGTKTFKDGRTLRMLIKSYQVSTADTHQVKLMIDRASAESRLMANLNERDPKRYLRIFGTLGPVTIPEEISRPGGVTEFHFMMEFRDLRKLTVSYFQTYFRPSVFLFKLSYLLNDLHSQRIVLNNLDTRSFGIDHLTGELVMVDLYAAFPARSPFMDVGVFTSVAPEGRAGGGPTFAWDQFCLGLMGKRLNFHETGKEELKLVSDLLDPNPEKRPNNQTVMKILDSIMSSSVVARPESSASTSPGLRGIPSSAPADSSSSSSTLGITVVPGSATRTALPVRHDETDCK